MAVLGAATGSLLLLVGIGRLYKLVKNRKNIELKKNFKRNGGLLLQQQLSSSDGSIQKTKMFTSKELEKATDRFNDNRILGQGGQGTVYKGMQADGMIVALLSGQKPISYERPEDRRSLATHFILLMEENKIFDILDERLMGQGREEEVIAVAKLARRCLNLNGRKRPSMREVAILATCY
ncbi:hypothetical protein POTOM_003868 [Populus tomentosa]|uniref:Uncharacterized protein n=1 Tax=Populus tomentosa TaxID=118781 RepID=A0A8X8AEC1_POPTO|nr:hypothetical protein POTOM_003868 [Populus tomentosa]